MQYQPTYKPVAKWLPVLANPKTTRSKRKQIAVAVGRQFSVDWWRVRTRPLPSRRPGLENKPGDAGRCARAAGQENQGRTEL